LALRDVFGGGTIDKDDELLNDVVLEVAKVIFIVGILRENHGIITLTCASKHQQWRVIFIVFALALDFLSLTPPGKKLSKSSKRMKENR